MTPENNQIENETKKKVKPTAEFVHTVMGYFSPLQSEITERNQIVSKNDGFIYGNSLMSSLDIPVGHDKTPINWLRRAVEIHRSQFMGKGFTIDSTYTTQDLNNFGDDAEQKKRVTIENNKNKQYATKRRQLCEAIIRDNGGFALWATAAENASAVGDTIIKAWYDNRQKKYIIQQVEAIDNFYALWSKDNYRDADCYAYVYQVSKQTAVRDYGVSADVQMSPLGSPLIALSPINMKDYLTTKPMVTVMEIRGIVEGYKSAIINGKTKIVPCKVGQEDDIHAIIVGDEVVSVSNDFKDMPEYYILPNKRARRRPWGLSDISDAAIQINLTYIETLSDWRTVASRVNFPKYKAIGFPPGVQMPKPKPRTVEMLPLTTGQDIQAISTGQSGMMAESDFKRQLEEMENQFVREVAISRQLFDMPDGPSNSTNPAAITAMKSVSDVTNAKRELWSPIIAKIFQDALTKLALYNKDIKEVVEADDWDIKVSFPTAMNADDPSYHAMVLNQFNTGLLSVATYMEKMGSDQSEVDRIREEMEDPITAAIHGHQLPLMATQKITPPGEPQPKVNISLRGDMTPEQEANIAYKQGFNDGPFPMSAGPQGNQGLTAQSNVDNANYIVGKRNYGGEAINRGPNGQPIQQGQQPQGEAQPQPQGQGNPELVNATSANKPGMGIMSQPGTGAPMTSASGKLKQMQQRQGA